MEEHWKPVFGFEDLYEISNFGNVRNIKTKALKKPTALVENGRVSRMFVLLWRNNKATNKKIHRMVLEAFVGPCPKGMEGCHNDGDPTNNKVNNLRWDTPGSNQADRVIHGTSNRGERCASHKLTKEQVAAIRLDNRLQKEIAAEYCVGQNTISRIKSGKRWAWLQ